MTPTPDPVELLRDTLGATVVADHRSPASEIVPLVRQDRRCCWAGCGALAVVAVQDCWGRRYLCTEHWRTAAARSADPHLGLVARASRPDYDRWLSRVVVARGCARPVRLCPSMLRADPATGELSPAVAEDAAGPDGVIYKACGDRRASVCPTCAETYRADTWQLVVAGLRGGKGVPDTVTAHPTLFVTLTAPSFGAVHTRRTTGTGRGVPCRPRRRQSLCPHGADVRCDQVHTEDEPCLGLPLCLDCYDHAGQVVWNAHAGELWRRTVIGLRRVLARAARQHGVHVRLSYAKVAEFQRRGIVHLHALLRLDGIDRADPDRIITPPSCLDAAFLEEAVRRAVAETSFATVPHRSRPEGWRITWGEQLDIRHVRIRECGEITDTAVAAYLAKYATKSTETTGHVSQRLTGATVKLYADSASHAGRLVAACWQLGGRDGYPGLRRWAHMLGFGGHFSTKSRRYSTTLRTLRAARQAWRRRREVIEQRDHAGEETTLVIGSWSFAGIGWRTAADALLAGTAAALARERRRAARDEIGRIREELV
jgi:Replication initiator protein, pSAM2